MLHIISDWDILNVELPNLVSFLASLDSVVEYFVQVLRWFTTLLSIYFIVDFIRVRWSMLYNFGNSSSVFSMRGLPALNIMYLLFVLVGHFLAMDMLSTSFFIESTSSTLTVYDYSSFWSDGSGLMALGNVLDS